LIQRFTDLISTGAPLELHHDKDPTPFFTPDPMVNKDLMIEDWKKKGHDDEAVKAKLKELEVINHSDAFTYDPEDQTKCPYAAHIRKCGPRDDFPGYEKHLMMRRGIPYGPQTEQNEKAGFVSQHDRGLLFVSYQSSIENGFRFVQKGTSSSHR
jgi:deferrochelatase/peroxidase EfeB